MTDEHALSFQQVEGMTLVTLHTSEITFEVEQVLEKNLAGPQVAGNPPRIVMDLSHLRVLGSIGLSLLVVFLKRVKQKDERFALAGLGGQCLNVMKVVGLTRVFDLHPDVPAALEALRH